MSRQSETEKRRVVVTGMGVVSSVGLTLKSFWSAILNGTSGARQVSRFDVSNMPTTIAAEITRFDIGDYFSAKKAKRFNLGMQYAAVASLEAVLDSRIKFEQYDADRVGLMHANSLEGMESAFQGHPEFLKSGYKILGPSYLLSNYFGATSGELAILHNIRGHAITYSSGSASGSDVVNLAASMIIEDEVDAMLVGASETPLLSPIFGGFCNARLMTKRNETPDKSMRAFDKSRDGFLLGEGSAFLVLEEMTKALSRGAQIYAEFVSGGRACEAFHPVNIDPNGLGIRLAINRSISKGRILPSDIGYINAHGTATESNDKVEAETIQSYFGDHAQSIAVNATKPVTGHLLAAAGALETVVTVQSLFHQIIPPTINLKEKIEGINLDFNLGKSRPYPIRYAMNLNAGFGGKNSCVIFKRFQG